MKSRKPLILIISLLMLSFLLKASIYATPNERNLLVASESPMQYLPYIINYINHDPERDALIALYNNTNGSDWINRSGWGFGDPCAPEWWGVDCLSGHVQRLNLSINQLNGTIPFELGNLSSLVGLDLSDNQLSGTIPPELGNLSSLEVLWLHDNQLSGDIPAMLSNLSSLEKLDLTGNTDLKCWETEEALSWALSLRWCTEFGCSQPGYFGPTEVCQP